LRLKSSRLRSVAVIGAALGPQIDDPVRFRHVQPHRGLIEHIELRASGYALKEDEPLEGYHRIYVDDQFGNRIELMEPN